MAWQVESKDDANYVKARTTHCIFVVEGKAPIGSPRKTWQKTCLCRHTSDESLSLQSP